MGNRNLENKPTSKFDPTDIPFDNKIYMTHIEINDKNTPFGTLCYKIIDSHGDIYGTRGKKSNDQIKIKLK